MKLKKNIISEIQSIISKARSNAVRKVNHERALMYWQIGKLIFKEEQQEKDCAEYGKFLIKSISNELSPQFGIGFSKRQLEYCCQFYRTFPIANALRSQFSWTHCKLLI